MLDGKVENIQFQASADFTGGTSVEQVLASALKKMEIEVSAARDFRRKVTLRGKRCMKQFIQK